MKIICATDRKPFVNKTAMLLGEIRDVSGEDAKLLISNGFARKATKEDEAPAEVESGDAG